MRAADFLAHCQNWRIHPKAQQDALGGVLDEVGWVQNVIVSARSKMIIDGHLRVLLALGRGDDTLVPHVEVDLSEEEERLVLATLDPLAAMAVADKEALAGLLGDLSGQDGELAKLLEMVAQQQRVIFGKLGLIDPDDIPDLPAEPVTQRGDLWLLGDHRLLCGDAPNDIQRLLDNLVPHLVLTDPPYGISIVKGLSSAIGGAKPFGRVRQPGGSPVGVLGGDSGRRLERLSGKVGKPGLVKPRLYAPIQNDDRPFDPTWLLSIGQNQIIWGGTYFASKLRDGTAWIAWDKGIGDEATFSGFELAWTSFLGRFRLYRHRWSGMVRQGSRKEELQDRIHPTQKPVGLFADILDDYSRRGDIVCDPYVGSGTTIIAAERQGRRCFAMDIEEKYVQVAIERWQSYTGKKAFLEATGESFVDVVERVQFAGQKAELANA